MATVPTSVGLHDLPTPGGPCEVHVCLLKFAFENLAVYFGVIICKLRM